MKSGKNKRIVQRGEKALQALRILAQPLSWRIIKHLETHEEVYPSKLAKALHISPATASRKLQDLLDLNLVDATWKLDTKKGQERPIKIFQIIPSIMLYNLKIGKPKGEKILEKGLRLGKKSNQIYVEFSGNYFSEKFTKDKKIAYCTVNDEAIAFHGRKAQLLQEIHRRNEIRLPDILYKRELKNPTEAKQILSDLLAEGAIRIEER